MNVSITTESVEDALAVPVDALLALAGGGYAVEVAEGRVHRLAAVTLGLFDDADGLVQVSGRGLSAGQRVVVPATHERAADRRRVPRTAQAPRCWSCAGEQGLRRRAAGLCAAGSQLRGAGG